MDALYAAIVLGSLGLVLGILIGICGKFLTIQKNEVVEEIYDLLPKINCGGCGNPSCMQMAEKLLKFAQFGVKLEFYQEFMDLQYLVVDKLKFFLLQHLQVQL